ncbi:UDP-2,4-diacetamido-2,4,6-trideoxy-beta-L-altropyranose hydrolase [Reichenbachiella sp.]|uniref:UDP-2,4-diacetamido-2,4, 6-trideoxy-beta-L-altropyranose hydrolase n=1 Tax=Reichenbachiella sp. TaxID=2184521 RepID=UPI003297DBF7
MNSKILIRVDANAEIGLGHFYRCISLAQMLDNSFSIIFAMSDPNQELTEIIKKRGYQLIKLSKLNYRKPDDIGDEEWQFDLVGVIDDVDIVVLDGYWFRSKYQTTLRNYNVKSVIIEDEGKGQYLADLIINHAPSLDSLDYTTDSSKTMFALGPEYALLRSGFLSIAKEFRRSLDSINSAFVCFGGADHENLSYHYIKYLLSHTQLKIHLIVSRTNSCWEKCQKMMKKNSDRLVVSTNLSTDDMILAMKKADFGIVPSSGILLECIACRLPVISGYYTDNQKSIYNGFLNSDVFINGNHLTKDTIFSQVSHSGFLNQLKLCVENQKMIIDGLSNYRLLRCFKKLVN